MFFKRRSRANSYIENDAPQRSQSYDDYEKVRPESAHTHHTHHTQQQQQQQQQQQPLSSPTEQDMYPRPQQPQEPQYSRGVTNGVNAMSLGQPTPPMSSGMKAEPPIGLPDLLTQAFAQSMRPYTEKIEQLESQLADMQAWVEQLEQQRAEVHSWIDKRGLRPGTPTRLLFNLPVY